MKVTRDAGVVTVEKLKASYGDSAVAGNLRYDPTPARARIEGQLDASMLDVPALQALAGEPIEAPGKQAEPPPESQSPASSLTNLDGQIALNVARARLAQGDVHDLAVTLKLQDGRLTVDPLKLAVGPGELSGSVTTGPLDKPLGGRGGAGRAVGRRRCADAQGKPARRHPHGQGRGNAARHRARPDREPEHGPDPRPDREAPPPAARRQAASAFFQRRAHRRRRATPRPSAPRERWARTSCRSTPMAASPRSSSATTPIR